MNQFIKISNHRQFRELYSASHHPEGLRYERPP